MPYENIENITRADVAFRVCGKDMEELFRSASEAILSVLIENPHSIKFAVEKQAAFEDEPDLLLFDFLQELIFYKDSESLILLPKVMHFSEAGKVFKLNCIFHGEQIDHIKHISGTDIKAVTMHNLKVKKTDKGWQGEFVLDV